MSIADLQDQSSIVNRQLQIDKQEAMNSSDPVAVRFAHFSDIHVMAAACRWRREDWFNKRLSAWLNLRLLGRGFRFRCTVKVLAALREDLKERGFDWMVFSGDATAMGFKEEMARAAQMLGVSVMTVNRRLHRALQLLTASLGDLYPGDEDPGGSSDTTGEGSTP